MKMLVLHHQVPFLRDTKDEITTTDWKIAAEV
jgi:hypothetical protein